MTLDDLENWARSDGLEALIPLSSLVAPAVVIGAAVGFGAQRLVQDFLSGFFIFAERQFGYGDIIRIAPPGAAAGVVATVEKVTLRATKLRTESSELVVVPNGEIRQVTNLSKDGHARPPADRESPSQPRGGTRQAACGRQRLRAGTRQRVWLGGRDQERE